MKKITDSWDEVEFEELEERLELGYCEKNYCSAQVTPQCTGVVCASKYAW